MLDLIKSKIASLTLNKKLKESTFESRSFHEFFKKSFSILMLMPENEKDFGQSVEVLKFLEQHKKRPVIFTFDYRVSLIPAKYRPAVIEHGIKDLNKLNLPSKELLQKFSETRFDAVIDLNLQDNLFYSYIALSLPAALKIGFLKKNSDKYYNVQVFNREDNPAISYKNLVNCLQKF